MNITYSMYDAFGMEIFHPTKDLFGERLRDFFIESTILQYATTDGSPGNILQEA